MFSQLHPELIYIHHQLAATKSKGPIVLKDDFKSTSQKEHVTECGLVSKLQIKWHIVEMSFINETLLLNTL